MKLEGGGHNEKTLNLNSRLGSFWNTWAPLPGETKIPGLLVSSRFTHLTFQIKKENPYLFFVLYIHRNG